MIRNTLFAENFHISLQSIRANLLRTVLTALIIAVGITALVGILTAIDSIKSMITEQFTFMGANTFTVTSRGMRVHLGNKRYRTKNYSYITYYQANEFKERYNFPATVSISLYATGTATLKYNTRKTNPNTTVRGVDENYLSTGGFEIDKGRNFSQHDITSGRRVVLLGSGLIKRLFPGNEDPLHKVVSIGSGKYKVIGILKSKGSGFGNSSDRVCFVPYTNVRVFFSRPNMNYDVQVKVANADFLEPAIGAAEADFRIVRGLAPVDDTDFNIEKSDNLVNIFLDNIKNITLAATIIGIITLFGAAVGLMNIMLVSVSERTREIGIRKAVGAKGRAIKQQFLAEAIIIGQMGGLLGVVAGILMGNFISMVMDSPFIIPWIWIFVGLILCFIVGIVSGYYPAMKASKYDPIESLRYE
ncbi:ABC-type antimicrobial peptide transport system, permease component [hydrothermal vent metagenome]|uniref:ABC-type antimicrobial peptide transport system, permease component n=1 Tax=hydrothermal vent metagenome TaxID=652676 RepID=A0A3B0U1G9_9ZZZZ